MQDEDLARLAAAGDAAAFAVLVRRHQSWLRGFLRRLARGDRALADDLAQETFLEAWRKAAQFEARGSFAGWLTRIAFSRYLMEARRRRLEPLDAPEESEAPQPADPDLRLDLERAMARLSLAERAALTVCAALGHSHEEGAEILGMKLGTLKSHILRGRDKLKRMLETGS
ncbi:MAG TPA: sigma-70 family RNA polymerase sigma factor [Rhizomicrobium sp.]|nr:sigma-70 family RNA polymerase sigma factor [Rhizomicrobium sp.]